MLRADIIEACNSADFTKLEEIVLERPESVLAEDRRGKSALYYAAESNKGGHPHECVRLLITNKADVHAQARSGRTALFCACKTGNIHTFDVLVANGALHNIKDRDGISPVRELEYAFETRKGSNSPIIVIHVFDFA